MTYTHRDAYDLARGRRVGRALLTFQARRGRVLPTAPDVVVKVDADVLRSRPTTLARLLAAFAADRRLGLASGGRCEHDGAMWRRRHVTGARPRACGRAYRWECWQAVQPLEAVMGWDGVTRPRPPCAGAAHRRGGRARCSATTGRSTAATCAASPPAPPRVKAGHYMGYRAELPAGARALAAARRARGARSAVGLCAGRRAPPPPLPGSAGAPRRCAPPAGPRAICWPAGVRRGDEPRSGPIRSTSCLVLAHPGGHLSDLLALRAAWAGRCCAWVSFEQAPTCVRGCTTSSLHFGHGPTNRNLVNLARNLAAAWRAIGPHRRPRVVVTSGAGLGVPFAWVARVRGARVIYIESA